MRSTISSFRFSRLWMKSTFLQFRKGLHSVPNDNGSIPWYLACSSRHICRPNWQFSVESLQSCSFLPAMAHKRCQLFFFSFPLFETVVLCVPRREISNFGRDFAQAITIVTKLSHQLPCNTDCRSEGSRDLPVRGDSAVWHKMLWLQSQKQWIWPKEYYLQQDLLFLRPFFFLMKIFHKRCFSVP